MNDIAIGLVRDSWSVVKKYEDTLTIFYEQLFLRYPPLEGLFGNNMDLQKHRLLAFLEVSIKNLEDFEQVSQIVRHLGKSHHNYRVQPEHFDAFGEAFIFAITHIIGLANFTDAMRKAWQETYNLIADEMKTGLAEQARIEQGRQS